MEYLITPQGEETLLRQALSTGVCYTTMLNALELFQAARDKAETEAIRQMLLAIRTLGFNSRYAEQFCGIGRDIELKTGFILSDREAMIIGMAHVSKLEILTKKLFERYKSFIAVPIRKDLKSVPQEKE